MDVLADGEGGYCLEEGPEDGLDELLCDGQVTEQGW